jgi:hypothetical protein
MMEDEEAEEIDNAVTEALPLPTPDQQQTSDTEEHEIIPYQPQPEETSEA